MLILKSKSLATSAHIKGTNKFSAKMHDKYLGISPEEFAALTARYRTFQNSCDDVSKEPVKVFSDLSEKSLAELYLIREVSKDLAKKKEEDMKRAAEKAAAMEQKPEEKTEDGAEEKKPETEK